MQGRLNLLSRAFLFFSSPGEKEGDLGKIRNQSRRYYRKLLMGILFIHHGFVISFVMF